MYFAYNFKYIKQYIYIAIVFFIKKSAAIKLKHKRTLHITTYYILNYYVYFYKVLLQLKQK